MSDVAIVILAAGMSRRLGRAKQVLPLAGEPVIAHVGRRASQTGAKRVVAVVGGARHQTSSALDGIVDEIVINDIYSEGQGTSIATAIKYLDGTSDVLGECDAAVFLLGDQPGIDPEVIEAVIAAWEEGAGIAMAEYEDRSGHPVLFDRAYWRELAALSGDMGGKLVIDRHRADVVYVPIESESPRDIDTEIDWRMLQEHWPHDE